VLIKNDGVLPLSPEVKRVAIIGPYGNATTAMEGNYFGAAPFVVTPVQGAITAGFDVRSAHGTDVSGTSDAGFAEAIEIVGSSDVAIFVGGIDHTIEDEGKDRLTLTWPGNQLELVKQLAALGKPVIVVQFGGGQIDDTELLTSDSVRPVSFAESISHWFCSSRFTLSYGLVTRVKVAERLFLTLLLARLLQLVVSLLPNILRITSNRSA
jgi:beta-D-xylosidase 4